MPYVRGQRGALWPSAHVFGACWEGPQSKYWMQLLCRTNTVLDYDLMADNSPAVDAGLSKHACLSKEAINHKHWGKAFSSFRACKLHLMFFTIFIYTTPSSRSGYLLWPSKQGVHSTRLCQTVASTHLFATDKLQMSMPWLTASHLLCLAHFFLPLTEDCRILTRLSDVISF